MDFSGGFSSFSQPGRWLDAFGQEDRSEGSGATGLQGSQKEISQDDHVLVGPTVLS